MNKLLTSTIAAFALASVPAVAQFPVILNVDVATDGIQGSLQGLVPSGRIEIGWLTPGTTQAQVQNWFATQDFAALDLAFHQVAGFNFPDGSLDFDSGGGQYFESIEVVANGNASGLAAYKNVSTGAAGKDMFSWVRNSVDPLATTEMAFIDGVGVFPEANDALNGTDFFRTFAHSVPPVGTTAWVGSIVAVTPGSAVDNFGDGNIAGDGLGATGSGFVLQLAAVPEPSTGLLLIGGLAAFAARRRRA
jgi:hypothetical protein